MEGEARRAESEDHENLVERNRRAAASRLEDVDERSSCHGGSEADEPAED